jgi:hypothetical protein
MTQVIALKNNTLTAHIQKKQQRFPSIAAITLFIEHYQKAIFSFN